MTPKALKLAENQLQINKDIFIHDISAYSMKGTHLPAPDLRPTVGGLKLVCILRRVLPKSTALIILMLLCCCLQTQAQQSVKKYVQENTVKIGSINPYGDNYDDLEALGTAIGDARIVMLGEQDHGDAPTFLAKTRIIRYLHEEKGFHVLAFESDFFALNAGWDGLPKNASAMVPFIKDNVFYLWTDCDACQYLLTDYLPATYMTESPLQVTGFDNQVILGYSYDSLSIMLDSVFRSYDLPVTHRPEYESSILPLIDSTAKWYKPYDDRALFDSCQAYFTGIRSELLDKISADDLWILVMDNLIAVNQEFQLFGIDDNAGNEVRDAQMARNIAWLSRVKYPDDKIIIWGHNMHVAKQVGDNHVKNFGDTSMGGFMAADSALIAQTYVLGFTSYEGSAARINGRMRAVSHKRNSFESWVDDSYFYGFLDFNNYSGDHARKFWVKGTTHKHSKEAWMQKFDGYFYIRTMYPCIDIGIKTPPSE